MTFRQFVVNYLSPGFFFLRCCWLWMAFIGWFFASAILADHGLNPKLWLLVGAVLMWNALRPWKVGPSINDIKNSIDRFNNRNR